MRPAHAAAAAAIVALAMLVSGCGSAGSNFGGRVRVVAAENFWGSIARQIGGAHAIVSSIIVNPALDPHSYDPTSIDARTLAEAQLAIINGIGYDPWAPRLLAANPVSGRVTLNVGALFGLHVGDNPHRWYDPADVVAVARRIAADLERLAPAHRAYFASRLRAFLGPGLATYFKSIATIRSRYAGVPVGASESIFAPLAAALHIRLITPPSFMDAVSEGTELTAQGTLTVEHQVSSRQVKVWVYNSQNVTPEIQRLNGLARAAGIPIVTVTETLSPATDSFQQWQDSQLSSLAAALGRATVR
ncbi:MAG: metal ABC transporter solute-binding protein, Zn/Mn family [Solirubrobacteraceae bacterium]